MTLLDAGPYTEWGSAYEGFKVGLEQIELVGGSIPMEQQCLLQDGNPTAALAIDFAPDILHRDGVDWRPLFTQDDTGRQRPVYLPKVVEVDWALEADMDDGDDMLFPSVPCRQLVHTGEGQLELDAVEVHRVWNLWPIQDTFVTMVLQAVEHWQAVHFDPINAWLEAHDDFRTACEQHCGSPPSTHRHAYTSVGDLIACEEGNDWYEAMRDQHFDLDADGLLVVKDLPDVVLPIFAEEVWRSLLASAEHNSHAALLTVPTWQREDLAMTERRYSPCMWSS